MDSNVLVYAHDLDAGDKQQRAVEIVRELWEHRNGCLSIQVLQEFYVNVTRKIPRKPGKSKARVLMRNYSLWKPETIDCADVVRASETEESHRIRFWDALIIVAVSKGGASRVLSEDFNPGQTIAGVTVEDPFV